ncbi:MAG: flavin reductase family protein [Candidatus Heimdallarchaeota archaeon]|nr:MAG: flavin reductase family protein [Candidatus Heimdallarchaeota archaeon]
MSIKRQKESREDNTAVKVEVSPQQGLMAFPGFPLVLVGVKDNIITVAAVSFFSFGKAPMVMIGIVPKRYSFTLIQESEDYSINIPTLELLEAVKFCGTKSGKDVNKFEATGLTLQKAQKIKSCLIKECPVSLECKIVHTIDLEGSHVWFVGEIVAAHKRKDYDRSQALIYWPREYRKVGEVIEN